MHTCPECKETKEPSQFYRDNSRKTKLTVYCRLCTNTRNKVSKLKNQEHVRLTGRTYMATKRSEPGYSDLEKSRYQRRVAKPENWPAVIWVSTKSRAKEKNIEFTIVVSDIVIPERCPIFNTVLKRGCGFNAPSIDRIDSTRGYVKDNIAVISRRANTIKNSGTAEEHRLIADWMDRNSSGR